MLKRFAKIGSGWKPLIIFEKYSTLDVWQCSEYTSTFGKTMILTF